MTTDHRVTPGLIHEILDTLERHGYYRSDDLLCTVIQDEDDGVIHGEDVRV
jgi:hypothetical protein